MRKGEDSALTVSIYHSLIPGCQPTFFRVSYPQQHVNSINIPSELQILLNSPSTLFLTILVSNVVFLIACGRLSFVRFVLTLSIWHVRGRDSQIHDVNDWRISGCSRSSPSETGRLLYCLCFVFWSSAQQRGRSKLGWLLKPSIRGAWTNRAQTGNFLLSLLYRIDFIPRKRHEIFVLAFAGHLALTRPLLPSRPLAGDLISLRFFFVYRYYRSCHSFPRLLIAYILYLYHHESRSLKGRCLVRPSRVCRPSW